MTVTHARYARRKDHLAPHTEMLHGPCLEERLARIAAHALRVHAELVRLKQLRPHSKRRCPCGRALKAAERAPCWRCRQEGRVA